MNKENYYKKLIEIDNEEPLFKNSYDYKSSDWRAFNDLDQWPVQRKLTTHECVFDLDHLTPIQIQLIPNYLKETGLKFMAWQTSDSGLHIHFWVNLYGKHQKKALVKFMAQKLESTFGIKNDLGPMGHGHIRTEFSFHPQKLTCKTLLMSTMSDLFPQNELPPSLLQKVAGLTSSDAFKSVNNSKLNGKSPMCIKYILNHKLHDGRERLLFAIISWFKANKLSEQEIFQRSYDWCKMQDYHISTSHIWAKIKTSTGQVGCSFRHQVLEELGVDMSCCKYE